MPTAPSQAAVLLSDDRSSLLFPALGLPISIRGVSFRNRIVQAPMCAMYANADGSATRQNVEYYRTRAAGGAGLIIVEITFTDDAGSRAFHAQLGAHDDRMIPGLTDIAEAVRAEGAVAGLQLGHCGAQRVVSEPPALAPSAIAWAPGKRVPIELTREEIARIVQDHTDATRRAVQAGFQLLELHAAHGYLVNTFLSPATNQRTDEYGGSFENRLRFPREVIAAMRAELGPRGLLCARLNGDDLLPGGLTINEYCKIAPALVEAGLDLIHVSAGTYRVMEKRIPPMYLAGETFAVYAGPIRRAAKVPTIASGTIHDPAEANRLIADDEADFVSLARPLFADPALPNKLLQNRPGDVLPCIRCNTCLAREQAGGRGYCAVNPKTGGIRARDAGIIREDDCRYRRRPRWNPIGSVRIRAGARGRPVGTREQDRRPGAACLGAPVQAHLAAAPRLLRDRARTRRCRRSLWRERAGRHNRRGRHRARGRADLGTRSKPLPGRLRFPL
jgi:2,4-dienoyl-CoA reductase-like NADH-dependent reductase (Old Yellow Enzyme family)